MIFFKKYTPFQPKKRTFFVNIVTANNMDIISQWRKRVLNPEIMKPQGVKKLCKEERNQSTRNGLWTGYWAYVYGPLADWNQAFKSPSSSVARGQK